MGSSRVGKLVAVWSIGENKLVDHLEEVSVRRTQEPGMFIARVHSIVESGAPNFKSTAVMQECPVWNAEYCPDLGLDEEFKFVWFVV